MKKPVRLSKIYNFDKPIVYIIDGDDKTIGHIQMDTDEDMNEFKEIFEKSKESG